MRMTRSITNRITPIRSEAIFLLAELIICFLLWSGTGPKAAAAEIPDVDEASDTVLIRVEGQLEEVDREALLDRINAIRREACEEGIDNPVTGTALTPEDYVPLQWSYALEEIAAVRAAESTILQDHIRPDGTECFTAAPEGVSFTAETLAWGFGSALAAVEGWYSEKDSYLNEDGMPAGHYMALINPEYRSVGIADLHAAWRRDACAAAFGKEDAGGENPAETDRETAVLWQIPVKKELLPAVIEKTIGVIAGRIWRAAAPG